MKKLHAILIACITLAVLGLPALAAEGPAKPDAANQAKKPLRIDTLTEQLGLDAKQRAAIGKLYKAESDQVKAIRADEKLGKKEQNARVAKIRAKLKTDIRAELTPEQAKKFDAMN